MDRYEQDAFLATLDSNEMLERLISTIIFNSGIDFEILVCSNQKLVELTIEYISHELKAQDEPREFMTVVKGRKEIDETLISIQSVLAQHKESEDERVYIFDFSLYGSFYQHEIEKLFSKLNELRNSILNQLNSSVLFVLPHRYKMSFLSMAPDFCSIAKYMVDIDFNLSTEEANSNSEVYDNRTQQKGIDAELARLNEENSRLKALQKSDIAQRLLLINTVELGDYYNLYGDLDEAKRYYKRALKMSQDIAQKRPDSIEAKRDVSVSLNKIANIHLQKGDGDKALQGYEESLKLREQIAQKRPDSIEAKRDVSVSLEKIANIHLQKGDGDKALQGYEESLKLAEQIAQKRPDSIEAKRDLCVSHYKLAKVYEKSSQVNQALIEYKKAIGIIEPLQNYPLGDFKNMLEILKKSIEALES